MKIRNRPRRRRPGRRGRHRHHRQRPWPAPTRRHRRPRLAAVRRRPRQAGRGRRRATATPTRASRCAPTRQLLTGDVAAKVTAAAKAKEPTATIQRVETDSDGVYEAHMVRADGTQIIVQIGQELRRDQRPGAVLGGRGTAGRAPAGVRAALVHAPPPPAAGARRPTTLGACTAGARYAAGLSSRGIPAPACGGREDDREAGGGAGARVLRGAQWAPAQAN